MSSIPSPDDVVERLVEFACLAPSVQNTQPWRWQQDGHRVTLFSDPSRMLPVADPRGRNVVISCGAALHHLQFAARALGWQTTVRYFPADADPGALAEVSVTREFPLPAVPSDIAVLRARCTDRRRFTAWPVADDRLRHLCQVAAVWGADARAVTDDASRIRLELLSHIAGSRFERSAIDDGPFVFQGGDRAIVLGGVHDDIGDWLLTGQSLSALWLEATALGMSVVPMSQPIEHDVVRREIGASVLDGAFEAHLLVAIGWQAIGRRELPRTSRRPVSEVLRRVGRRSPRPVASVHGLRVATGGRVES